MSLVREFLKSFREVDTSEPGLFQKEDGTVWLRNPDQSETQLPGGGGGSFTGWTEDAANPANVDSNGGNLDVGSLIADASAANLGDPSRQFWISILNSQLDTSGSGGFPPAFFDILGNFVITGLGTSEIGPLGSFGMRRNLDGSGASMQVSGASLSVTTTLDSIGRAWQATHLYYGGGSYDVRIVPITPNGHIYGTSDTGLSGGSEPVWPTDGSTVVDGALTWTDFGLGTITPPLYVVGPRSNDGAIYPPVHIAEFWAAYDKPQPAWGLGASGEEILWATTSPADADVATGSRAQTYDDTINAPRLLIKERDSAGTLFNRIAAVLIDDASAFAGISKPTVPAIPVPQDIVDALVTLGLVLQSP